ncbi:MAG: amino acid ABC transporter substrate-binding protein [Alphaproteobacteria bacterium]
MMPAKTNYDSKCRRFRALSLIALTISLGSFQVEAGEILARVQARQRLNCGVSDGRLGFSYQDAKGRWSGLDVDFCRAVAAAVIGDAGKVKYFPLMTAERFIALRSNEIDLLARNTTWTIGREAGLGVHFIGTLYYDGQGFMVSRKGRAKKLADLKGAKICVTQKTTTEEHLADYFGSRGWKYQPVLAKFVAEASKGFFAGRCAAYTADRSNLAAVRLSAPGGPKGYEILPEQISKEPLAPAIKRGDEEWLTLLRWIRFATIEAEEEGVTSKNIRVKTLNGKDPDLAKFLDANGLFAKELGVKPGWVPRILEAVGNYGEMFERNLGQGSALKLDRGLNRLWTKGGLMYSPPFL